jgi:hypothetical protein
MTTTGQALRSHLRPYNDPDFDFLGLTVREQNQIFQDKSWGGGLLAGGLRCDFDLPRTKRFTTSALAEAIPARRRQEQCENGSRHAP